MKRLSIARVSMLLFAGLLVYAAIAWQSGPASQTLQIKDTTPDKEKKIRNIDDAIEQLEKAKLQVEMSMSEKEWKKVEKDIQKSMEDIRLNKVQIEKEMAHALKELDAEKLKMQTEQAIAKVDWEGIKKELQRVKEIDFTKMEAELSRIKPELEKSMTQARESMAKAKVEMEAYKSFINDLHKDGLIDKNKNYKIEWRGGVLTINDKKQEGEVAKKYPFLKGKKDFSIVKDEDDFNIHNERQ